MIGFGPSISDVSLSSLSMVLGKSNSSNDTTELAQSRMRQCDLKFFVSCKTLGGWNSECKPETALLSSKIVLRS